jgi:hypothetical protein
MQFIQNSNDDSPGSGSNSDDDAPGGGVHSATLSCNAFP